MAAKTSSPPRRKTEGRYSGSSGTIPGELPREGKRRGGIHVVHATVSDPNPAIVGRQRVAVNRKNDALEDAYASGRVSDAAYAAGRVYQAILERAAGIRDGGDLSGVRADPISARDLLMIYRIEHAREAVELLDETARIVGKVGGMVLEKTLGFDRITISELARRMGGGRLALAYYSRTFVDSLENLAAYWAKHGESHPSPN